MICSIHIYSSVSQCWWWTACLLSGLSVFWSSATLLGFPILKHKVRYFQAYLKCCPQKSRHSTLYLWWIHFQQWISNGDFSQCHREKLHRPHKDQSDQVYTYTHTHMLDDFIKQHEWCWQTGWERSHYLTLDANMLNFDHLTHVGLSKQVRKTFSFIHKTWQIYSFINSISSVTIRLISVVIYCCS